ncbi:hypothetical protein [Dactylosporangium sp. CS-033363]|uniref:hypothetical protein n=1 Tax=Dactylosporangium sp. CS-033363 TaxID=3239935 RepID=UPI003D8B9FF0
MGASGWGYHTEYQPDLQRALEQLQARVLADGDYWWAAEGKRASDCTNRPRSMAALLADDHVQQSGTHSILDMNRVLPLGEQPQLGWMGDIQAILNAGRGADAIEHLGRPEFGTVTQVTPAEALELTGTATLTREHLTALDDLRYYVGFGRCAVLHDTRAEPIEIYFWGASGD